MYDGLAPSAHVGTPKCQFSTVPDFVFVSSTFSPLLSFSLKGVGMEGFGVVLGRKTWVCSLLVEK